MNEQIHIQRELGGEGKSKLTLYGELVVGSTKVSRIVLYELIQLFAAYVPGALGIVLRGKLYPLLLKSCGKGVTFGRAVVLRHPHKISIGDGTVIDDNCLLDAKGKDNTGIQIGSGVFLGRNSILSCKNGDLILGNQVNIGFNSEVFSGSRVELGEGVLVAAYVYVVGGGHKFGDAENSILEQEHTSEGISIGPGSWLGAGAKIMDGVTIGTKCVIGAGAVVTKSLDDGVIAAGIPAKVLRKA